MILPYIGQLGKNNPLFHDCGGLFIYLFFVNGKKLLFIYVCSIMPIKTYPLEWYTEMKIKRCSCILCEF